MVDRWRRCRCDGVAVRRMVAPTTTVGAAMRQGHPLVWGWTVCVVIVAAAGTTNLIALAWLVACLISAGLLVSGPRRASFAVALGVSLATALWWCAATLILPTGSGPVLFALPQWQPGPGVAFGGQVTVGAASHGLARAMSAIAIILVLGLAGQLVGARSWLALTRLTGPLAPALAPLACLGEACVEVTAAGRAGRRPGRVGRRSALTGFLTALADLSCWQPSPAAAGLPRPRTTDLFHIAAPVALTTVLLIPDRLVPDSVLQSAELVPPIPWLFLGAALLIPLGVIGRA